MRFRWWFVLLALALPLHAQAKPGYTVTIHVQESRIQDLCDSVSCTLLQELRVTIDGKRYELQAQSAVYVDELIALGDYPAKVVLDTAKPTHEFRRTYELLFADGTTRKFAVIETAEGSGGPDKEKTPPA